MEEEIGIEIVVQLLFRFAIYEHFVFYNFIKLLVGFNLRVKCMNEESVLKNIVNLIYLC